MKLARRRNITGYQSGLSKRTVPAPRISSGAQTGTDTDYKEHNRLLSGLPWKQREQSRVPGIKGQES